MHSNNHQLHSYFRFNWAIVSVISILRSGTIFSKPTRSVVLRCSIMFWNPYTFFNAFIDTISLHFLSNWYMWIIMLLAIETWIELLMTHVIHSAKNQLYFWTMIISSFQIFQEMMDLWGNPVILVRPIVWKWMFYNLVGFIVVLFWHCDLFTLCTICSK